MRWIFHCSQAHCSALSRLPNRRALIQLDAKAALLMPERPLQAGEQYRFHFDMTKCIGCKCCVVACNEQNGNPAAINWRRVGEVEGGHYPNTQRHHLSMGCNHCLEPSCLIGCPVEAYTKDPVTGVVIHSADACIGCQYCTWNCSYGVPQYNAERGVVGKCDMCHNRIADDMAPACVAACPEGAIAIEIVNVAEWRSDYLSANAPGLPSADDSISTTRITLPEDLPPDTGRVDTQRIVPEHPHWPLVFMLVLTQLSAGAFAMFWLWMPLGSGAALDRLLLGVAGLGWNQPRRRDPASGAADLCVARAERSAAVLAEPRSLDSFHFRGIGSRLCRDAVLLHFPGRLAAGLLTVLCGCLGVILFGADLYGSCAARMEQPLHARGVLLHRPAAGAAVRAGLSKRNAIGTLDGIWLARAAVTGGSGAAS